MKPLASWARRAGALVTVLLAVSPSTSLATGKSAEWFDIGTGSWSELRWRTFRGDSMLEESRVRTTLTECADGFVWFRHVSDAGQASEGGYCQGGGDDFTSGTKPAEIVCADTVLNIGSDRVHCRVMRTTQVSGPECGNDPVSHWVSQTTRWISRDFPRMNGKVREIRGPTTTYYADGQVISGNSSDLWEVIRLKERVRVGKRQFDCCVARSNTDKPNETVTWWICEQVPEGWVRQVFERVDPSTGAVVDRREAMLIDFEVRPRNCPREQGSD